MTLPQLKQRYFDNCPRGFEEELTLLLYEYALAALEHQRQIEAHEARKVPRVIANIKHDNLGHPYAAMRTAYDNEGNGLKDGAALVLAPAPPAPQAMESLPPEMETTMTNGERIEAELMARQKVLHDVSTERIRQDQKWGGSENDDRWDALDWYEMIADYNGWARRMATMNSFDKARNRYVQIAALAVAAVEALDRKSPHAGGSR